MTKAELLKECILLENERDEAFLDTDQQAQLTGQAMAEATRAVDAYALLVEMFVTLQEYQKACSAFASATITELSNKLGESNDG